MKAKSEFARGKTPLCKKNDRYPLRGTPYRYDAPTESVAVDDWEAPSFPIHPHFQHGGAMQIDYTVHIWKEGNQYVAHALPLDVMSSGVTVEEARTALDEAVHLFLTTSS